MALKQYLPKSLFGRSLLIIVIPVLVMQTVVAYLFFEAHWDRVTANLSASVAADVSVVVELYKQNPSLESSRAIDEMIRPNMELSVELNQGDTLPTATRDAFFSVLDKTLQRALSNSLSDPYWFDTTRYPNHIDIRVAVDDGVLRFIAARERVFAPTGFIFLFWMLVATFLLTLVSIIFIRNQARPISRLAAAADAFGKGQDLSDYKPSGASEVRLAGHSFLKMRQRIRRHIEQRTALLAGVSHDLRTPLTRLKLHLAMQDDSEENLAARRDLKDMETMLDGYLDFARGLVGEAAEAVVMDEFLTDLTGQSGFERVTLSIEQTVSLLIQPVAMKRALTNIIGNGLKYADNVRVTLNTSPTHALILIEDDGPGIPEARREDVFKPFLRLDAARNQNIEGVGLGLSIARDIIQSHGGQLRLEDSEMGGLKAVVQLPL